MRPQLVALFLVMFVLVLTAIIFGFRFVEIRRNKRVSGMLQIVHGDKPGQNPKVMLADAAKLDSLQDLLAHSAFGARLDARIKQAGLNWTPFQLLLSTAVLASLGGLLGYKLVVLAFPAFSALLFAFIAGTLPWMVLSRSRAKRMNAFEKQFPEALDFVARSMRAGHAFSASLDMLAAESAAPLGPEFRKVYDEQNLGAPIDVVLRKLAERVPSLDVRFFVSAVLLQRETGGNLSEILGNLSHVIRERFKLKGHVRAVSAHGRITASILTVLPIATVLGLTLVAPSYLRSLSGGEYGKYLIVGAVIAQVLGYFWMRKIINIKI